MPNFIEKYYSVPKLLNVEIDHKISPLPIWRYIGNTETFSKRNVE